MITTYVAGHRLKLAPNVWREPGELVPEAAIWPRHESFLHTGKVKEITVEDAEFERALTEANPALTELQITQIREHHGIGTAYGLHGPHKTPFTRTQVLKEAAAQKAIEDHNANPVTLQGPVPTAHHPALKPAKKVVAKRVGPAQVREPRRSPGKRAGRRVVEVAPETA